MHVLHRPHHLHRALAAGLVAAVLAILITLVIANNLNDLSSGSTPTGASTQGTALQVPAAGVQIRDPFIRSAFTGPFSAPIRLPWTEESVPAAGAGRHGAVAAHA